MLPNEWNPVETVRLLQACTTHHAAEKPRRTLRKTPTKTSQALGQLDAELSSTPFRNTRFPSPFHSPWMQPLVWSCFSFPAFPEEPTHRQHAILPTTRPRHGLCERRYSCTSSVCPSTGRASSLVCVPAWRINAGCPLSRRWYRSIGRMGAWSNSRTDSTSSLEAPRMALTRSARGSPGEREGRQCRGTRQDHRRDKHQPP